MITEQFGANGESHAAGDPVQERENTPFGWWRYDLKTGMVTASAATRRIYGLPDDQVPISVVQSVPLSEYRSKLDDALRGLLQDAKPYDVEFEIRRPTDGEVRLVHSVAEFDVEREVVIGTVQDITDRKRTETKIRDERQRLEFIIDGSRLGTWEWNVQTSDTIFNETWASMLGYSLAELEPISLETWSRLTHPEDLEKARQHLARCFTGESPYYTCEIRMRHKDGHWVWILDRGAIMARDPEGNPLRMFGTHADISERKAAEHAAAESHALLENLASLVPGVIYQYRLYPDGRSAFPYSSPGMFDIYEVTPDDVREDATPVFHRLHPDDHVRVAEAIFESARALSLFYCEFRVVLPRQGLRWRQCEARPERMADGGTLWHGIITDITERKEAEAERDRLRGQLAQSQRLESVGRLAGGVAHDFNNMLSVILGHADLMLDDLPEGSPMRDDILEISKAAMRSADLTRQLLAFARKQNVIPKTLDLNETIGSMIKMLKRLIGEDIELTWSPAGNLAPVRIDPAQVDQILANLVVNARDAIGHATGRVTIETSAVQLDAGHCAGHDGVAPGRFVQIAVRDTGCGMDDTMKAQIFEPFFTTKAVGEGTGLGLATIYGIVRQNRGIVEVESSPGSGATFRIYLPVYEAAAAEVSKEPTQPAPVARGPETVLLVEDEAAILALETRMLERLGYAVIPAQTPHEALRLAESRESRIDLLVTDVVMPDMNGLELSQAIADRHPETKRLFVSGYTADIIAHRGIVNQGIDLLEKPFSIRELGEKVRAILEA